MVDKWTVLERFAIGSKMKREEWIITVSRKASEIVKKYKIKYKPLTSMDISEEKYETAEKVWNAGIELAATMGCYDLETDRIAKFTEDEIRQYIRNLPTELWLGKDKELRLMKKRRINGFEPCLIGGGGMVPCSFDVAPKLYRAIASLPYVDWIEGFNLPYIGPWGVEQFRVASLSQDILAGIYQAKQLRRAINDAGRSGLCIFWYPQSKIAATHIAALNPEWGIRPTDMMRGIGNFQLTIEQNWLAIAIACQNYGCNIATSGFSSVEFAGGIENAMICGIAGGVLSAIVYGGKGINRLGGVLGGRATYGGYNRVSSKQTSETQKPVSLWYRQLSDIIHEKYIPGPTLRPVTGSPYDPNHPLRWLFLASSTMDTVSTGSHPSCYRPGIPRRPNLLTPLEVQLVAEVAKACVKNRIKDVEATEISGRLMQKTPQQIGIPSHNHYTTHLKGKPFEELYDLTKFIPTPKEEHLKSYEIAKKQIITAGLPLE